MLVSEHPVLSMLAMLLALCALAPILLGAVLIHELQVGIVVEDRDAICIFVGSKDLAALLTEHGFTTANHGGLILCAGSFGEKQLIFEYVQFPWLAALWFEYSPVLPDYQRQFEF